MNTSELTAPEDDAELKQSAIHSPATFAGKELWPYTPATRFYFFEGCEPADLVSTRDLLFCYVHLKRGGDLMRNDVYTIMPMLRDADALRVVLAEWLDELSGGDMERADALIQEARSLREAAMNPKAAAPVEVSPVPATPKAEKKRVRK